MQHKLQKITEAIETLEKVDGKSKAVKKTIIELEKLTEVIEGQLDRKRTPWEKVQLARKLERPRGRFYIDHLTDVFIECHGDRHYGDDPAIIGGIAQIEGHIVTLIVQERGQSTKESVAAHFGMPHPEGYRKALRLMKQAEKFHRPIICLIDTPGAYCGIGAEERGQGEAIARNLLEMSRLHTPIISGIIGEGGSGGALALAVSDRLFMQENSVFSILSPEGFASILWKDASKAQLASESMKLTAQDLLSFQIIDDIIKEPVGGAHMAPLQAAEELKAYLDSQLNQLQQVPVNELVQRRYERLRKCQSVMV